MRDRLKELIDELGISRREFARNCGIPPASLDHLLAGKTDSLSGSTLAAIARTYSVNVNWLLLGEGGMFLTERDLQPNPQGDRDRALLARLHGNPTLYSIVERVLQTGGDLAEVYDAVSRLPRSERKTALKMLNALTGG